MKKTIPTIAKLIKAFIDFMQLTESEGVNINEEYTLFIHCLEEPSILVYNL